MLVRINRFNNSSNNLTRCLLRAGAGLTGSGYNSGCDVASHSSSKLQLLFTILVAKLTAFSSGMLFCCASLQFPVQLSLADVNTQLNSQFNKQRAMERYGLADPAPKYPNVFGIFEKRSSVGMPKTEVVTLDDDAEVNSEGNTKSQSHNKVTTRDGQLPDLSRAVFVDSNPASHLLPPDQDPQVRITSDAPGPFIGMALAHQQGNSDMAERYAGQYVRYLVNLMYQVSELTRYVSEALYREGLAEESEIMGVGQFLDMEFARAREEKGDVVKPKHEHAMRRVKPDPKSEAYVYFFFSLPCRYCREMAPDMERLWRVAKGDKRVKMVGMVLGDAPAPWIKSYRDYTGLSMPILAGEGLAKMFRIKYLPAVVVISPGNNISYLKTGKVEFLRLYELLRAVQGLPTAPTPAVERLARVERIGAVERGQTEAKNTRLNQAGLNQAGISQGLNQGGENRNPGNRSEKGGRDDSSESIAKLRDEISKL